MKLFRWYYGESVLLTTWANWTEKLCLCKRGRLFLQAEALKSKTSLHLSRVIWYLNSVLKRSQRPIISLLLNWSLLILQGIIQLLWLNRKYGYPQWYSSSRRNQYPHCICFLGGICHSKDSTLQWSCLFSKVVSEGFKE